MTPLESSRVKNSKVLDAGEPPSATGLYPDPVWAVATALEGEVVEAEAPEPPSPTGVYPSPVWDATPVTTESLAAAMQLDPASKQKDSGYAEEFTDEAEPEQDSAEEINAALNNREIYRIVREVAVADSGDELYAAVDAQDGYGLCFGLVLFTQRSGHLGSVLRLMMARDESTFRAIFGPQSDALLTVTNAPDERQRMAAVGGERLVSPAWMQRFRAAGAVIAFHAAQNEQAIEGMFRPILQVTSELGIDTDRGLAMVFDRVVARGLGGGLGWVVRAAGPLSTAAQRMHALEMLGFQDLTSFQTSTGWVPANGEFTARTHAAMVGALRRQGEAALPAAEDYMSRMVAAATGSAKSRLLRLRDSTALEDVAYRFD